jgi:hypothetical protein
VVYGRTEWYGVGVLACLFGLAFLICELARVFRGIQADSDLASVGLALALAISTAIAFQSQSLSRHWPGWFGLLMAVALVTTSALRAVTHLPSRDVTRPPVIRWPERL